MQFQVPQFIEVEDKIFGPLTLKQFIYLAGGVGTVAIFWSVLPLWLAIALGLPVIALSAGLAFYRINDQPLVRILEAGFRYLRGRKLYVWEKREAERARRHEAKEAPAPLIEVPKLSESKLKDLAWSLDVQESLYAGESEEQRKRALSHLETGDES